MDASEPASHAEPRRTADSFPGQAVEDRVRGPRAREDRNGGVAPPAVPALAGAGAPQSTQSTRRVLGERGSRGGRGVGEVQILAGETLEFEGPEDVEVPADEDPGRVRPDEPELAIR